MTLGTGLGFLSILLGVGLIVWDVWAWWGIVLVPGTAFTISLWSVAGYLVILLGIFFFVKGITKKVTN